MLFSIFMLPLAVVCYCWTMLAVPKRLDDDVSLTVAGLVTWAFVAVYWTMLWQNSVRWTRGRWAIPCAVAVFGVAVEIIAPLMFKPPGPGFSGFDDRIFRTFSLLVLSIFVPASWLVVTLLVWRETVAERVCRLRNLRPTPTCVPDIP
jgi:hypothetical protein